MTDDETMKKWKAELLNLSEAERKAKEAMRIPAKNAINGPGTTIHALGRGPYLGFLCGGHMFSAGVLEFTYKQVTCKDCKKALGIK